MESRKISQEVSIILFEFGKFFSFKKFTVIQKFG